TSYRDRTLSNWPTKEIAMFKHILLPTDGSELSEAAIQKGIQFAKSINAEVTGFYVILPFHVLSLRTGILEDTKEQYERQSKDQAEQFLGVIKKAAEKAGVSCDTDYVTSSHPYEMIIKAAEKKGCDLIMMASHGRRGLQGLLIGSETHKVLTHTKIPVLVFR
ncbi:MAG TPA: universal stress protein, partial [Nitrososphaera sp.]|nr:universal stress protein [Nitrososphaera sp.]